MQFCASVYRGRIDHHTYQHNGMALVGISTRPVVLRWNGRRWRRQPSPVPAGANQTSLSAVSCPARASCTAVGKFSSAAADGRWVMNMPPNDVVEHWSGGATWTIQQQRGAVGTSADQLSGVSCPSSTECIAVGSWTSTSDSLGIAVQHTLAERWDGTRWSTQATPDPTSIVPTEPDSGELTSVSCGSPTACVAVGRSSHGTPLTEIWNGSEWSIAAAAIPAGTTANSNSLGAVSCTSPAACTAVGTSGNAPLIERWNGSAWSIQPIPSILGAYSFGLTGVSCSSDTRCVAVGSSLALSPSGALNLVSASWDGNSWTVQDMVSPSLPPGPVRPLEPNAVSCSTPTNCTAVGYLIQAWDGVNWTQQPATLPATSTAGLTSVSCATSSPCVTVGSGLLESWDGVSWTVQQMPVISGGTDQTLNAASCASASACIAIGAYKNSTGNVVPFAARYG